MFGKVRKFWKRFFNVIAWMVTISLLKKIEKCTKIIVNINDITPRKSLKLAKKIMKLVKKSESRFKFAKKISHFI